jgi:hypothetical protein
MNRTGKTLTLTVTSILLLTAVAASLFAIEPLNTTKKSDSNAAARTNFPNPPAKGAKDQEDAAKNPEEVQRQLAERDVQYKIKRYLEQQSQPPLPPIENGQVKVYTFKYAAPRDAAETIESLLGKQAMRIAVDDRTNSLIVYGKAESMPALDTLVTRLDEQSRPESASDKASSTAAAPRSYMLRVFWLADGVSEVVGQKPSDYLPKSVLQACHQLGLESPRLITQSVNSLAIGHDEGGEFETNVPALLDHQTANLISEGHVRLMADDRARLDMRVLVSGQTLNCEVRGSAAIPLGHYIVLGTANSVLADIHNSGPMGPGGPGAGEAVAPGVAGAAGMAPGAEGPGGRFAGPFGRPGGAASGGAFVPMNPTDVPMSTSRFAFVVQVVDGQSYPAEKTTADSE